jgi:pimeloyl-ACP methyl ester carboxylesterase
VLPEIAVKKTYTVHGREYPVIEAGEGPLVVCLHGFPDNYETWQGQIEPLVAAGYRIVCPVMPGFAPGTENTSGSNTSVYAVDELIAVIEALLGSSDEKKCHLVGHDWGALVAYMIAHERPDLLHSLTALSIPYNVNLQRVLLRCPTYVLNSWYISFFQLKWFADWVVRRKNFKFFDLLYRLWCPTWDNKESSEERLASTKASFSAPGVLGWTLSYNRNCIFGLNAASFRFRRIFNGVIKVPTLGIRGEVDGCLPEVTWNMVRPKSFPNGLTMERMPNVGHFPQLEDPEWVSKRLIRWVGENSA